MARPSKLTPRVRIAICEAIGIGAHRELSARYAGVCVETLYRWLREARQELDRRQKGEEPNAENNRYVKFLQAVEDAEANAGIGWAQVVDKAAQQDPAWAWRMLKLRFPDGFHETDRQDINLLNVDVEKLSDEQLERLANGESLAAILAIASKGRIGAEETAESPVQPEAVV